MILLAYFAALLIPIGVMLYFGLRCSHPANSRQWPINGVERCFMCQKVRRYPWNDELWMYDIRQKPGRWHREKVAAESRIKETA